ncbi:MAG: hypothetical protein HQ505_02810, partial [Nitrosopumilus sp.]|nr:hypothetical protein [Nitrosopumilus sp.]
DTMSTKKGISITLEETLGLSDTLDADTSFTITLSETANLSENITTDASKQIILSETFGLSDTMSTKKGISITLEETLGLSDTLDADTSFTITLEETLGLSDTLDTDTSFTKSLTESISFSHGTVTQKTPSTPTLADPIIINPSSNASTITVTASNSVIVIPSGGLATTTINVNVTNTDSVFLDSSNLATTTATTKDVTYPSGFTVNRDENSDSNLEVITTFFDNTKVSGTNTWDGKLELLSATTATVPTSSSTVNGITTTITYDPVLVVEFGSDQRLSLDKPIRIEFPSQGNKGLSAFFKQGSEETKIITTVCTGDTLAALDGINGAGQLKAGDECWKDDGIRVYLWTTHLTSFGVSKGTSSSSGTATSAGSSSGSSGGGGSTGHSSGAGAAGGFGGILATPLAINEVSYDKCTENMARILVSSDADTPPTVKISTAKSGVVYAALAKVQPYEEINQFSTLDRYLYEMPISSEESFLMISVTEEKGTTNHTVQASVKLLSCEGTSVFIPLPEYDLPEVPESTTRIFDAKVQIANGTTYDANTESEFLYLDGQDLRVSAIIDSDTLLERVELRSITLGQPDDQFMSIRMDVASLYVSDSMNLVSGVIPSFFMVEPGMAYWLYITDENGSISESTHYNIGVKPTTTSNVAIEVDMPTIAPSGSTIKPEFYIFNEDSPSYGIVSLVVDGQTVSKKSQLFGTGQTQVIFNWNIPKSDGYITYDFEGKVDLYDTTIVTESALVSSYPKTISVAASEMPALQVITQDEQVLADPALVYASNSNSELRFKVTDPQGQCIIGGAAECLVKDNTLGNRGGLESVPYGEQILRIKYSGSDNVLERFSITSIDPIIGQWNVSLESDDEFVQEAHASEDPTVKIKYRYHSETITVKSQ